jgi:predicted RNase H-like nuclease (RuvC/YqgF family)
MKYWDIRDAAEEGIFILFDNKREAQEWLDDHAKRFPKHTEENGMHIVECERQTLSEKCVQLEHTIEALQQEIKSLNERIDEGNVKCLECASKNAAYQASVTRWRQGNYHNPADVAEIARLSKWHGCGCGICLAHNNMICPKLAEKAGGEK